MDKPRIKYQIFVSSTFVDLEKERDLVIKAILEMGHIPIGMEMFSAGDDEQWKIIQSQIDDSDYYVVIVAHRYGSVVEDISYTEKEYDYAAEKKIPSLGFVIADDAVWPHEKFETNQKERLDKFKTKLRSKLISHWSNKEDLYGKVSISLMKQFNTNPRKGWIKYGEQSPEELKELISLFEQIQSLQKEKDTFKNKEDFYKDIIRNNTVSFGRILKDAKTVLFDEMSNAVEMSFKFSTDNLNQILNNSLKIITDSLCDIIEKQIRTKSANEEVAVSIKAFVNEGNAKKILINDSTTIQDIENIINSDDKQQYIITLARDSKTIKNNPNREIKTKYFGVTRNSDFSRIIGGEDYFYSNDLNYESEENGYINESPNWRVNYNATAVVPIYYLPRGKSERQIFGFLTVDSLNNADGKLFNRKDTIPILEFGAELLTIIFLNLGLYEKRQNENSDS